MRKRERGSDRDYRDRQIREIYTEIYTKIEVERQKVRETDRERDK